VIGRLSGIVLEKNPPQILLDVQGVGYEVEVPMNTFYNLPGIGEKTVLHTQLIIREDAHLLFGFGTLDERTTFRELLKISGVGPKMALAVLSGLSLADLADAVARKETGRLVKIPGVGKKTAERLILELQGKFVAAPVAGKLGGATAVPAGSDITHALQALGYSEKEAGWAAQQLPADVSVSDGIRQALKLLSKA
jgi:Holliday junction DNA helicase RuvA